MEKHADSADRVVNIDETSRRLLPVRQIGWGRRGAKQAQFQGNTKEATTFTIVFTVARWTCWCRSCTRARQTPVLPEQPWPERTHHVHVRERLGNDDNDPAARGHSGQRAAPE